MIFTPQFNENGILSEYPRPQMRRDSYFNLNGEWDYAIIKTGEKFVGFDGKIVVPYSPESSLSKVNRQLLADETLIYSRKFTLPDGFNRGKVLINFGAVDQVAQVFINGKAVGKHEGGYTPFSFDITEFLVEGENTLRVEVVDNASSAIYGRGKQKYDRGGIWYTATSGIWQTVWLESVPLNYVRSFKFVPDFNNKTLSVSLDSVGDIKDFRVEVVGDNGNIIVSGAGEVNRETVLNVDGCLPWSPDSPQLYPVNIYYGDDKIESYFGLRSYSKVKVDGKEFFAVNDKPTFNNGLLDQGYFHDGIYTPSSNRVYYDEIKAVKDMGFNMLRKHIKIEPMLWYYYCDILGVLVWQDMINGGDKYKNLRIILAPFINLNLDDTDYKSMGRNALSRKQYYAESTEELNALFNCVSLCVWTPFNEAWGQFDSIKVWKYLSELDPTRLYDHASGWQDHGGGDFCSKHIYFRRAKMKNDGVRVLALTEFGGYSLSVEGHTFTDKKFGYKRFNSIDKLQVAYENLYLDEVISLIREQGLCATVYTQLSDVEDEVNGLFTYDRILKFNPDKIREINDKVYSAFDKLFK